MILGGVATGSIKAELQAKARQKAKITEFKFICSEIANIIGIKILAEAVLEASSVNIMVKSTRPTRRSITPASPAFWDMKRASLLASPVSKRIFPRERPEPNKRREDQSMREISLEVSILS